MNVNATADTLTTATMAAFAALDGVRTLYGLTKAEYRQLLSVLLMDDAIATLSAENRRRMRQDLGRRPRAAGAITVSPPALSSAVPSSALRRPARA